MRRVLREHKVQQALKVPSDHKVLRVQLVLRVIQGHKETQELKGQQVQRVQLEHKGQQVR